MAPIQLTAILTPKPGKSERFLQLFEDCYKYVKANEPYIHRYELHKAIPEMNDGVVQYVVLEGYDDQEALDKHMATPPVVTMMKALEKEDLVDTKIIRTTAGSAIKARI